MYSHTHNFYNTHKNTQTSHSHFHINTHKNPRTHAKKRHPFKNETNTVKRPLFTVSKRSIMIDGSLLYNRHVLLSSQPYDTSLWLSHSETLAVNQITA